jgi:hypothetical protein
MAATNQNCILKEIKSRLNSVANIFFFPSVYKTIILHVVLYECEIWSLALREKHSLRVF